MICGTVPFVLYNHFDNDDDLKCAIMEGMLNNEFRISEISNKLFCPFEINQGIEMPLTETDPHMPFCSDSHYIQNINCDYYLEEKFIKEIKHYSTKINYSSLFHLNV